MCKACVRQDTKNVVALQYVQCYGPVIYNKNAINGLCFMCGNAYENISSAIKRVESNRSLFKCVIKDIKEKVDIEFSLMMAQLSLDAIIKLVYNKSNHLLADIRELVRIYDKSGKSSDAIKYYIFFCPNSGSIEDLQRRANILNDSLLWTKVFYTHLKESKMDDKEDWKSCFRMYSNLMDILETIAQNQKKTQTMKKTLKTKKLKFEDMKKVFATL